MLVVVLKAWVTETNETPCASKSSTSVAKSVSDRVITAVRLRHNALRCGSWRQPPATIATPPFASRQRGGGGLFALKSLASAQPARPGQQRSLREPKPVLSAGNSKILVVGATVSPGQFSASPSRATVS